MSRLIRCGLLSSTMESFFAIFGLFLKNAARPCFSGDQSSRTAFLDAGFFFFRAFSCACSFFPFLLPPLVDLLDRVGRWIVKRRRAAGLEQHFQRVAFRVAVLAIAGEDVVVGGHPLEEDRSPYCCRCRDAELSGGRRASCRPFPGGREFQALKDLVAARIAGQQHAFAAEFRQHDDAGKVGHEFVDECRQRSFRRSLFLLLLFAQPFVVRLLQRQSSGCIGPTTVTFRPP